MLGDLAERYGPIYKFRVLHLHVGILCNLMNGPCQGARLVRLQPWREPEMSSPHIRHRNGLMGACLHTGGLHHRPGACHGHPEEPACRQSPFLVLVP